MRAALNALTEELRRLKSSGVKTVSVSDESVAALRRIVAARKTLSSTVGSALAPERVSPQRSAPSPTLRAGSSDDATPMKPYVPPAAYARRRQGRALGGAEGDRPQ
jgi:hypothetical protein